ncbi:cell division protein ZapE [Cellulosimicrobium funkei]|uniref:cell division protein ZapE n=1 Tax=Cellulosimicrobium TaxID=157920 RepID=UPI0014595D9F|nr:cell division protein ZapE [Cellulosimicrobium sp. XJ-DQ-B-000]MDQ8042058.1 cell division protein ZapE [Cellulosimicrobium sp. XJ-DQ-B-000]NMF30653.1 cell division protein ZapE [Cellulosimicrobium aquatile]
MTRPRADRVRRAVEAAAARDGIVLDAGQRDLLDRLARLGDDVARARRRPVRGLYVWGPVGRGKSWLATAFVDAVTPELPAGAVRRTHVYDLFRDLHAAIHARREAARAEPRAAVGHGGPTRGWRTRAPQAPEPPAPEPPGPEPLSPEVRPEDRPSAVDDAIDDLLRGTTLLLLDELHLHDTGDATLLTRLLRRAFAAGVVVLATSNYEPGTLLPNPLWHHVAEPGIALLRAHLDVVELAGPTDYRTLGGRGRAGFAAGAWLRPGTTAQLDARGLRRPGADEATAVRTGSRTFPVTAARADELWVTFDDLAGRATSTLEYLDWSVRFRRWVVTDVPQLTAVDREAQQRFVAVVDVLVDADVELVVTSPHALGTFRTALPDRPDAFRTASRLQLLTEDAGGTDPADDVPHA